MIKMFAGLAASVAFVSAAMAQDEPVDLNMINKIRDQGFNHSEVMETLGYMTDVIGPRLTGSPQMREANEWTLQKFREWGLRGELEGFEFGRGWTYEKVVIHMTEPRKVQLQAMPIAWHPGTNGVVSGETIKVKIESEEDFEKYKGKLAGKIVLLSDAREQSEPTKPIFRRHDEATLDERKVFNIPVSGDQDGIKEFAKLFTFQPKLFAFLKEEGVVAAINRSGRDAALLDAAGYLHKTGNTPEVPYVAVTSEDYERMLRLMDRDMTVRVEMEVEATFYDNDTKSYNTIAEIPGRSNEVVMAGAHLDSWFMGDGAVDNGAGSAMIMEAARILSALNVKPKRTIRFALWGGEEQGLYGSEHHVRTYYGDRPMTTDEEMIELPAIFWFNTTYPVTRKRDHNRLSAYFNLDNGSGRIRGIYGEGNVALKPIFESWFEPFEDLEAKTVTLNRTGGTDHLFFQWVGLPAFQFIQDPLDYGARLHHTQIDTFDHAYEADLKQGATILAAFLYNAAMRDEKLPRTPLPTEPPKKPEKKDAAEAE